MTVETADRTASPPGVMSAAARTRRIPLFRSHPSLPLVLAAFAVVDSVPSTSLAHTPGFSPLPAAFFAALVATVIGCVVLIEVGKRYSYRQAAVSTGKQHYNPRRALRRRAARFGSSL